MAKATKAVAAVKGKGKPGKGAKPVKGKRDKAQAVVVGPLERSPLGGILAARTGRIEMLLIKSKKPLTVVEVETQAKAKSGRRHLDVMTGAGLLERVDTGAGLGWQLKPEVRAHIAKGGVVRCHKRGGESPETFDKYLKRAKAMAGK